MLLSGQALIAFDLSAFLCRTDLVDLSTNFFQYPLGDRLEIDIALQVRQLSALIDEARCIVVANCLDDKGSQFFRVHFILQ
jgi:hypothetical protein